MVEGQALLFYSIQCFIHYILDLLWNLKATFAPLHVDRTAMGLLK